MRRILLFVIVSALYTSAFAQERKESKTRYYRHEVNVSRTGMIMPRSQWDDYKDRVYGAMSIEHQAEGYGIRFGPSSSGTLIGYYYHLNHLIAVGAMTAFTTHDSSLSGYYIVPFQIPYEYWDSKEHTLIEGYRTDYSKYVSGGKIREKSFFLMPSLKWSWLNNSWCSLYMKASFCLHYQQLETNTEEISLKSDENLDESKLWIAYIATPFGWEIGKQKVRGFFELGFGSNTNLQIGLTYRFGRY